MDTVDTDFVARVQISLQRDLVGSTIYVAIGDGTSYATTVPDRWAIQFATMLFGKVFTKVVAARYPNLPSICSDLKSAFEAVEHGRDTTTAAPAEHDHEVAQQ